MKPENKVYKEGEVYNNLKCYNTKFMQKKGAKKREKDGAKMEFRRDETINTHPFSHPWSNDNKKKEGVEFQNFPSSN